MPDGEMPTFPDKASYNDEKHEAVRFSWRTRMFDLIKKNHGLLLVVASQLFLSVVNIAVKKLNSIDPPVPTLELIIIRMGMTYVFSIGYMLYTKVPNPFLGPEGVRLLLIFRGFSGFFGLFGVYFALKYLSLSDATVLTFLVPLTTALSGAIFLKESFTRKELIAGILSLIGVIFIARPVSLFGHNTVDLPQLELEYTGSTNSGAVPMENMSEQGTPTERLIAVGVSLLGVLGSTGAYTAIRAIGKRAHALHSMASFSLQSVIASTLGMVVTRTPPVIPTKLVWLALLIEIGVFGFLAQVFLTMGLQRETAGRGTMAVYTQIVFASIGERIFFHVVPSALSIFGTLIIIGSALYVALTKEREGSEDGKANANVGEVALDDLGGSQAAMEEGLLANYDGSERVSGLDGSKPPKENELPVKSANEMSADVTMDIGKEKYHPILVDDNSSRDGFGGREGSCSSLHSPSSSSSSSSNVVDGETRVHT
ncbi:hypothetical protein VKT23_009362 [Stygiomarasmius scandens]|uniref:EamA domain-containing protein n=1 Tax=Marasmiellus scandens TaxID=2682957 RepID=A0ABR1JG99_9AGAR